MRPWLVPGGRFPVSPTQRVQPGGGGWGHSEMSNVTRSQNGMPPTGANCWAQRGAGRALRTPQSPSPPSGRGGRGGPRAHAVRSSSSEAAGGGSGNLVVLERDEVPGQSPYERLSQRMLDVSGDRGVLKDIIREGAGDLVAPDALVLVKFSGYLEHMDKPFDSNCYRKTPRLMKLGEDITLWGMELGLLSMRRGELARFLFKPTYAYGTLGCPPLIPPNSTVLFEIELLDFLDSAESDKFYALSAEEQDQFPLQKVLKVAATVREFGNYLFRQNRFYDAKVRYKRALLLLHRRLAPPEEQHLVEAAKLLVFLNLSLVYLKLDRPAAALRFGQQALTIDQRNAKALFRCGQACLLLTEYQQARDFLVRAQKEQPLNQDINNELRKLASCYKDYMDKEKEMCHRMFAACEDGSMVGGD
ncbi:inactive peptidyl-prolyl cis-trans isomerase FKBP6 isoform X1 [Dipodomys merriami]|uniref:inactive peptidyl-prolyl cis-trans isomerase FKBP6 isoform X1 n=1 Tax=Dipodomys merriami TaxID=94247 RepID=UPI003855B148